MGQRTQIIVVKENNKGEKAIYGFHDQWGYGRSMYFAFMDIFMEDYGKDVFREGYDFLAAPKMETRANVDRLDYFKEIEKHSPNVMSRCKALDRESLALLIQSRCDNNNGALVVHIKEDEVRYHPSNFKIGFLLGREDATYKQEAFNRWLTPIEYGKLNGGASYSDAEFCKIFDDFCQYCEVEYLKDEA